MVTRAVENGANAWPREYVVRLDSDTCTGCGACADVCPFGALQAGDRVSANAAKCWGCGICRSACPSGSLRLVDRREVPEVATLW
jgi:ferredoxin